MNSLNHRSSNTTGIKPSDIKSDSKQTTSKSGDKINNSDKKSTLKKN